MAYFVSKMNAHRGERIIAVSSLRLDMWNAIKGDSELLQAYVSFHFFAKTMAQLWPADDSDDGIDDDLDSGPDDFVEDNGSVDDLDGGNGNGRLGAGIAGTSVVRNTCAGSVTDKEGNQRPCKTPVNKAGDSCYHHKGSRLARCKRKSN